MWFLACIEWTAVTLNQQYIGAAYVIIVMSVEYSVCICISWKLIDVHNNCSCNWKTTTEITLRCAQSFVSLSIGHQFTGRCEAPPGSRGCRKFATYRWIIEKNASAVSMAVRPVFKSCHRRWILRVKTSRKSYLRSKLCVCCKSGVFKN